MDEQAGLENRSPSRDRGFESHPLRHNTKAIPLSVELPYQFIAVYAGGIRTGVLKGVRPLHGVTGATRRREGVWPPSGSTEAFLCATSNPHPLRQHGVRVRLLLRKAVPVLLLLLLLLQRGVRVRLLLLFSSPHPGFSSGPTDPIFRTTSPPVGLVRVRAWVLRALSGRVEGAGWKG